MASFFKTMDKLKPGFDIAYNIILLACKVMLVLEVILAAIMVGGRYIFHNQPPWASELILTFMVYMTMLSAALALRRGAHIRMNAFDKYLPKLALELLDLLADVGIFVFAVIMIKEGWLFASTAKGTYSSMPFLSKGFLYMPIPVAGVCTLVFQLETLYNQIKGFFVKEEKE